MISLLAEKELDHLRKDNIDKVQRSGFPALRQLFTLCEKRGKMKNEQQCLICSEILKTDQEKRSGLCELHYGKAVGYCEAPGDKGAK